MTDTPKRDIARAKLVSEATEMAEALLWVPARKPHRPTLQNASELLQRIAAFLNKEPSR